MSLPNITFIKSQGGLKRPLPGQDFISGLVFYTGTLPSGFTLSNNIKALFSPADAIAAGILNDYSDATPAVGSYLVTTAGTNGDVLTISVNAIDATGKAVSIVIAIYTKSASETTPTNVATAIAALINAGNLTHGFSATPTTATVAITAPKKYGIFLNSGTPIVTAASAGATIAGTITQFTGGVASILAFYNYHISEFFRMQPQGILYTGFFPVPGGSYTFTEIPTIQNFSVGTIRHVGLFKNFSSAWSINDLTTIDTICKASDVLHKNISALYAADLSGTADIMTLADLNTLSANKSMTCIGQDAGGQGNFLFKTIGKSITTLGAQLGTSALKKVSESIAWVGKFNISNGVECETVGFANGQLLSALSDNSLGVLNDRRYVFLRKFTGVSGSYFNDSHMAVNVSSDYAYLENNDVIDKAIRGIYSSLLPQLNSPLQLNSDGTLSETTTASLESLAAVNLDQMVRDGELSDYGVSINPAQNVLTSSKIIVVVQLLINGVARQIEVPIGFTLSIS